MAVLVTLQRSIKVSGQGRRWAALAGPAYAATAKNSALHAVGWARSRHSSKAHLKPPDVIVEVLRRWAAEWSYEPVAAGVKRVHILDVVAPGCDTGAWFTADDEMFDSTLSGNLRIIAGPIRAKHRILGHQRLHRTFQRRALSVW
tara:strand:- start:124 stop:558 length:435 start_codon:yes stop_codon:yes gene_type:complete